MKQEMPQYPGCLTQWEEAAWEIGEGQKEGDGEERNGLWAADIPISLVLTASGRLSSVT